ncbi:hypothetical protein [Robertmurraya massiliosenegalensis]|uniref:hypothetical protein n=1 Tax=Robertmurraya massiliosenegalensis TaxID=1287657 RepID=UPI0002F34DA6|nr:hypothetical protein [Robertmurraya massiliosenegalensis]
MELVQKLISCSRELVAVLENQKLERDEKIKKTEETLIQREEIISELKQRGSFITSTPSEDSKIIEMEQRLEKGLNALFATIKSDLKEVKQRKRSRQPYTNPYSNLATYDGSYYDKRK